MTGILEDVASLLEREAASKAKIQTAARAVLSLRHADDVAFRAAANVLVTEVLGPGAFDASVTTEEKSELPVRGAVLEQGPEHDASTRYEKCDCGCDRWLAVKS